MFFVHHEARNMQTRLASARITGKFTRYDTNSNVKTLDYEDGWKMQIKY